MSDAALDFRRLLPDRSLLRLAAFALLTLLVFSLSANSFFTVINFQSMGFQVAEVGLLSLAVMLAMLTGGIDLSVVSIAAVAAIVASQLFAATNAASATGTTALLMSVAFSLAGIVVGTACGLVNGFLIARLRITPILATLGTMQLLNGLMVAWTNGAAIYGMPDVFLSIGVGTVFLVPVVIIGLILAALLTAAFMNRTGTGLRMKLVGANPIAARYSGVNNERVLVLTYLASAFLASVAGIIIASRAASANADYGASYVLLAIVICMLAGVNPNGGYATVTGVIIAAFTLQMVASGMNQVGFNAFHYQIVQGVILIGVIGLAAFADRGGFVGLMRRGTPAVRRATEGTTPAGPAT
jgi:simple sugar transport system permease protein